MRNQGSGVRKHPTLRGGVCAVRGAHAMQSVGSTQVAMFSIPAPSCAGRPHAASRPAQCGGDRHLRCARRAGRPRAPEGSSRTARSCQPPKPPWAPTSGSNAAISSVTSLTRLLMYRSGASGITTARRSIWAEWSPYGARGSCPVTSPVSSRTRPFSPRTHGTPAESSPATKPMPSCAHRPGTRPGQRSWRSSRVSRTRRVHVQQAEVS